MRAFDETGLKLSRMQAGAAILSMKPFGYLGGAIYWIDSASEILDGSPKAERETFAGLFDPGVFATSAFIYYHQ